MAVCMGVMRVAQQRPLWRVLRRELCLTSFTQLMDRGLGIDAKIRELKQPLAEALRQHGWFACDGFISDEACSAIRDEVTALRAQGLLSQSYSEVPETGEKIWRQNVEAMELNSQSWQTAPMLVVYLASLMRELPAAINENFPDMRLCDSDFGHKLAVSAGGGAFCKCYQSPHIVNGVQATDHQCLCV